MKKGSVIWIVACAILVVILVIAAYFIYSQKKEMEDFKTQVEIENERKELEKEYAEKLNRTRLENKSWMPKK